MSDSLSLHLNEERERGRERERQTETETEPGNGAGLFLQSRSPHWADNELEATCNRTDKLNTLQFTAHLVRVILLQCSTEVCVACCCINSFTEKPSQQINIVDISRAATYTDVMRHDQSLYKHITTITSTSRGRFTHHGVYASGSCSSDHGNASPWEPTATLWSGVVGSAAQGTSAPTEGGEGRGSHTACSANKWTEQISK